jgi:hydroxyethylthiazole kinase-like uncharacterized protein yjeF
MTELLTAAQMRAIEQAAIASGEVTGLELMERAGRGVVEAIMEWRPELAVTAHRAVVLCGPGNNGGDGFAVARLLKQRGWEVEVFLYGDEAKLPPDAAENCRRWREMGEVGALGFPTLTEADTERLASAIYQVSGTKLLVDALFGTGLTRPISDLQPLLEYSDLYATSPDLMPLRTVAIDIPSGICSDSGKVPAEAEHQGLPWTAMQADLTVTFHRVKLGHLLGQAPLFCGRVRTKSIGLEQPQMDGLVAQCQPALERLKKHAITHKYSHGHALILAGGVGRGGAARLTARGALRVGAGLVTLGPPSVAIIENAAQLNAIMLRRVADADALAEILKDERINALCLGPGLGVGARTLGLVAAALASKRNTVLDADALTSFAEDPSKLFALAHENCVLTPHMGEFARLFPDIAAKLEEPATKGPAYSKVDAAREAAARAGCVILLKGADTVIADPHGRAAINSAHYERAAPWLATAGSGDVLAGMITGLLARGLGTMAAAETAAWLHVEAARKFGPGLIAEDLPEMIPAVFRDLGL